MSALLTGLESYPTARGYTLIMIPSDDMPAIFGGRPIRPQGPPDWPFPDEEILKALRVAYQDGSWGKYQGNYVPRLEERLAQYHGVEFSATCGSGTFAVELALRALKIEPGDEVIQSAYDYGGNFLSIHAVGAMPVLVDVQPDNWNLDPQCLEAAIGPKTRAVIATHLHGGLVPMPEVMTIAAAHGLMVIEDAAQMPGATIQGRKAGTWGDVGILSFGGSKLLTAGRGGAILTRNAEVYQRARLWLNRGNHVCPLSELQAAVLLPQLDKLDACNQQRTKNVRLLVERLRDLENAFRPFTNHCPDSQPGYYKLGFQFNRAGFAGLSRERFLTAVRAEGIAFDEGFRSLHVGRSPTRFRQAGDLGQATRAHEATVILHHPVLLGTSLDMDEVARAIGKVRAHAEQLRGQS